MCFYDQIRFSCGDWKWSHFRQHCNREYRIGETCGMKLVQSTIDNADLCKLCEKLKTKYRRRQAEVDRIQRWSKEGSRYRASIDKALATINELDTEITNILTEKQRRSMGIGAQSSHPVMYQTAAY